MLSLNKYLKTFKLLIICLFSFSNYIAQNLIANSSFENTINNYDCSGSYANYQISAPVFGAPFIDSWLGVQSPDYFNTSCFSPSPYQYGYGTPANRFGYMQPKTGIAYSGFLVFAIQGEYKEFVFQHLSSPLILGKSYCLSFYVSRADRNQYTIKNIGAYLSATIPSSNSPVSNYFNFIPQVVNQSGFITDTTQWTQIQGCFTANGGEEYITIGNFNYNVNTDTLYVGTNHPDPLYTNPLYDYSYYYIDDVSLYDSLDYVLITKTNELRKLNEMFSVYPNPANDVLHLDIKSKKMLKQVQHDGTIKITDVVGREVKKIQYSEEIDISDLEQGIYFLSLYQNNKLLVTQKIIKE